MRVALCRSAKRRFHFFRLCYPREREASSRVCSVCRQGRANTLVCFSARQCCEVCSFTSRQAGDRKERVGIACWILSLNAQCIRRTKGVKRSARMRSRARCEARRPEAYRPARCRLLTFIATHLTPSCGASDEGILASGELSHLTQHREWLSGSLAGRTLNAADRSSRKWQTTGSSISPRQLDDYSRHERLHPHVGLVDANDDAVCAEALPVVMQ